LATCAISACVESVVCVGGVVGVGSVRVPLVVAGGGSETSCVDFGGLVAFYAFLRGHVEERVPEKGTPEGCRSGFNENGCLGGVKEPDSTRIVAAGRDLYGWCGDEKQGL